MARSGCFLTGLLLLIAWAVIGWALWQAALNAPMPEKESDGAPFEFIPSQEEPAQ
ncbi:MAG: hypothetical protein HDQ44_01200 [Desulfovibrio sp.]|nr:hypothetical protein [Desulfovibrio sp.]